MQEEFNFDVTPNTVIPINVAELASAIEIRALSKRGSDKFISFPYDKLTVRAGHNGRTDKNQGFSKESLEELARSIFSIGLQEPLTIDIYKDGTGVILKGERRWRAIGIIREWISKGNLKELLADGEKVKNMPDFNMVECFTTSKHYNENDRIIAMLVENIARENLTPMEEAEGYMRLRNNGMTAAQIARSIPGLSPMQLSNRLRLGGLSPAEKGLIDEGKISPTAAVKLAGVVEDAEERVSIIEDAAHGSDGKLKISDLIDRIEINEANEDTLSPEEFNSLRNGDLVDPIKSGAGDDPSMRGTSPKHKPDAPVKGDPAVKYVDQPLEDFNDEKLKSGDKTAFDLTLKVMAELKEMEGILGRDADDRLVALMGSMEKKLYDIKVILKLKKKK